MKFSRFKHAFRAAVQSDSFIRLPPFFSTVKRVLKIFFKIFWDSFEARNRAVDTPFKLWYNAVKYSVKGHKIEKAMRIDKYLKNSRLIKRRTVAKEACDTGRVSINGKVAKAGSEVNVGDIIHIEFGNGSITARVTDIIESARKETAALMYEIIE